MAETQSKEIQLAAEQPQFAAQIATISVSVPVEEHDGSVQEVDRVAIISVAHVMGLKEYVGERTTRDRGSRAFLVKAGMPRAMDAAVAKGFGKQTAPSAAAARDTRCASKIKPPRRLSSGAALFSYFCLLR